MEHIVMCYAQNKKKSLVISIAQMRISDTDQPPVPVAGRTSYKPGEIVALQIVPISSFPWRAELIVRETPQTEPCLEACFEGTTSAPGPPVPTISKLEGCE